MTMTAVPTTIAYRSAVARSAATGEAISPAAWMAVGDGTAPYSPDADAGLAAEITRVPAQATADGPVMRVRATITGALLPAGRRVTEFGVITAAGVLIGRRVIKPVELEAFGELDLEIEFEY